MRTVNRYEQWYIETGNRIIKEGQFRGDRTGTGVYSLPFINYTHDLRINHPLMSTREFVYHQPITEMIWMMSGSSNIEYLVKNGCPFWNCFATHGDEVTTEVLDRAERIRLYAEKRGASYAEAITMFMHESFSTVDALLDKEQIPNRVDIKPHAGELGPVYGVQWRNWPNVDGTTFDQLEYAYQQLACNPESRRIVVDCWNPSYLPDPKKSPRQNAAEGKMALTPCFVAGTPVLTPSGYVNIEDLNEGDIVITDKGNKQSINHKWITEYEGELIGFSLAYQSEIIQCTPNHPFLIKDKGYVEAKDIVPSDMFGIVRPKFSGQPYSNSWSVKNSYQQDVEHVEELSKEDYYFLGYYLGNGWTSQTQPRVSIAIPNSKADWLLPKLRNTLKLILKPGTSPNVQTYSTKSQKWWGVLKQFGYMAGGKTIPEWVFESPKEYVEEFIAGYKEADGFVSKNGKWTSCTTVSRSLAYGLQRLYSGFGTHAAVYKQKRKPTTIIEGRTVNQQDTYIVNTRDRNVHEVVVDEDYLWIPLKAIGKREDTCLVYNHDVGTDHTYVVHNYATHNCHFAFGFYVETIPYHERAELLIKVLGKDGAACYPIRSDKKTVKRMEKLFMEYGIPEYYLDVNFVMRSNDWVLGQPANMNMYSALCMMYANELNMVPRFVNYTGWDCHIYSNHLEGWKEINRRWDTGDFKYTDHKVTLDSSPLGLFNYHKSDFSCTGYAPAPKIKFPIAI